MSALLGADAFEPNSEPIWAKAGLAKLASSSPVPSQFAMRRRAQRQKINTKKFNTRSHNDTALFANLKVDETPKSALYTPAKFQLGAGRRFRLALEVIV